RAATSAAAAIGARSSGASHGRPANESAAAGMASAGCDSQSNEKKPLSILYHGNSSTLAKASSTQPTTSRRIGLAGECGKVDRALRRGGFSVRERKATAGRR